MVFEKLYKFIGKNIKNLIDKPDEPHCFRLHKQRVFYVKESIMKKATNVSSPQPHQPKPMFKSASHLQVAREKLVSLGTCIGKLTHSGKFRLGVGATDLLAQYAKCKVLVSCHLLLIILISCYHAIMLISGHQAITPAACRK